MDDAAWKASLEATAEAARNARHPTAPGPGADAEALRQAYLGLLKLAVCDLVGPTTESLTPAPDGTVVSQVLEGGWKRIRSAGLDWPRYGLTMVGLARLDDLQACVEAVAAEGIEGDVIEAGSWRGGAALLARATLDSLGDDREVVVADSFAGFRAAEEGDSDLTRFEHLIASEEEVRDSFARLGLDRGVTFLPGFFDETLPGLAGRRWSLVRLDGDTYEATRLGLDCLYDGLSPGGFLVLDDYGSFQGAKQATDDFRAERGITEPLERIDYTGARWRRTA
jgi:O-methyltransferase